MKTLNNNSSNLSISWETPNHILFEMVCMRNHNHEIWRRRAKKTSFRFDREFLSTVRYYIGDRKKYSRKLELLFLHFRDEDECRIEESYHVHIIKRDILAIVAKCQRRFQRTVQHDDYVAPWYIDDCALMAAHYIQDYVDEWWNCGATIGQY